jgi:hypothetical protein
MPIRRLASAALVAGLVALLGGTGSAQFNPFKKLPKAPPLPNAPVHPPKHTFKCSEIDDALVDKFLKGRDARKKVEDEEAATANQTGGKNAEAKEAGTLAVSSAAGAANIPFGRGSSVSKSKADKAEEDTSGLDRDQLAAFAECCIGVLHDEAQVLSQTPQSSMEAILKREGELSKVCK